MDMNKPVAWINVEKRKLEWANPTLWETPTVVKLDRIPLYTHPVKKPMMVLDGNRVYPAFKELTDEEIEELIWNTTDMKDFARAILRKAQEQ